MATGNARQAKRAHFVTVERREADLYTISEAATMIGLDAKALTTMVEQGHVDHVDVYEGGAKRYRIRLATIQELAERAGVDLRPPPKTPHELYLERKEMRAR